MNKLLNSRKALGLGLAALSLAVVAPGRADDEKKLAPPREVSSTPNPASGPMILSDTPHPCHIPADLHDKPFDRFADVLLLGEAWDYHDAGMLLDIGLQLVEGERVLLRPHKAFDSGRILVLAAHIAGDRRDSATLDRLAKVVAARKDKDDALTTALKEARKITGEEPSEADRLGETLEDVTPVTLQIHQAAIRKIRSLRLAGNLKGLEDFDKHLDQIPALHAGQQNHLDQEIAWARNHMPKDASLATTIQLLDRLGTLVPCTKID
jgi:hypothetical protein